MPPADENLSIDLQSLEKLKSGDEGALTLIYKKYWQMLFTSAYNILKDRQLCEDIIQEIFIKLWNNREKVQVEISLKGYLYACTRYEVYRQVKAGLSRKDLYDDLLLHLYKPAIDESIEYKELIATITAVVDELPEKCREVFKLSRDEQLSHKEIASRLSISPKTVENHITKALRHLRLSLNSILLLIISVLIR